MCDAECGGGIRARTRDCENAEKHRTYYQTMMLKLMGREDLICYGSDEVPENMQEEACNESECVYACKSIDTFTHYAALTENGKIECTNTDYCTTLCTDETQVG